ncbi:MAG: nitrilase-related carbon-nitrogen hydrolase, partial [Gemmatimonadaceae bacterium]
MISSRVIVAVVQDEVLAQSSVALERTAQLVRDAAADGAKLVVFPETWIPGYPAWLDVCRDAALWDHPPVKSVFARMAAESIAVPGPSFDLLAAAARDTNITLVIGVTERVEQGVGRGTL